MYTHKLPRIPLLAAKADLSYLHLQLNSKTDTFVTDAIMVIVNTHTADIALRATTNDLNTAILDLPVTNASWSSDKIFIHPSRTNNAQNYALLQSSGGNTYLNSPSSVRLRVSNSDYIQLWNNTIYQYKTVSNSSDSRLKFNQRPVKDALETVRALQPKLYEKVDSLGDQPTAENPTEAGFVAQEVEEIPSLKHCVHPPSEGNEIYGLDYRQLGSPYAIAAIQELAALVESLTARMAALEKDSAFGTKNNS
jgi:hypothetical protein